MHVRTNNLLMKIKAVQYLSLVREDRRIGRRWFYARSGGGTSRSTAVHSAVSEVAGPSQAMTGKSCENSGRALMSVGTAASQFID
jgi:hypothetical protein